jgi:hypothetical protein
MFKVSFWTEEGNGSAPRPPKGGVKVAGVSSGGGQLAIHHAVPTLDSLKGISPSSLTTQINRLYVQLKYCCQV